MIETTVEKAFCDQIHQEFVAAYNYLGMSVYFEGRSLDGFAQWMKLQHDEELTHAMRLFRYLLDRGGIVSLGAIPEVPVYFNNTLEVFETSLDLERENTAGINALYELASTHNDYASKSHLQWFLDEQVEEEKSIEDILNLLKMAKDDATALLFLDNKLGARSVEAPESA